MFVGQKKVSNLMMRMRKNTCGSWNIIRYLNKINKDIGLGSVEMSYSILVTDKLISFCHWECFDVVKFHHKWISRLHHLQVRHTRGLPMPTTRIRPSMEFLQIFDYHGFVFPETILKDVLCFRQNQVNLMTRPTAVPSISSEIVRTGARVPVFLLTSVRGWGITSSGSNWQLDETDRR